MSRCVVVIGIPRSGTSAVAGTLHHMGVNMGDKFQDSDPFNERGYYEDLDWQSLNKSVCGLRYGTDNPDVLPDKMLKACRDLARNSAGMKLLWGMKDPRLCFTARHILPMLVEMCDVRLIITYRDLNASIRSLFNHSQHAYQGLHKMTLVEATEVIKTYHTALKELMSDHIPRMAVSYQQVVYEHLVSSPRAVVRQMAEFAFEGSGVQPDIESGVQFIDRELDHWGK